MRRELLKPVVKLRKARAPFLIIALTGSLWIQPRSAQAYEEDTHFTLTYVFCRAVGFTDAEALVVARYDQGIDDSPGTVANGGLGGIIPNVAEEHQWHAFTQNGTAAEVLKRRNDLWAQVLNEKDPDSQLKRLGVFYHFQQDNWAHRYHPNASATNFKPYSVPFGHALHGHQPDRVPFDPICALRCLEEGIVYAKAFMTTALKRTPNTLFDNYQPAMGQVDGGWNDSRKGKYFNQLASDKSTPARYLLTDLIRAQVDAYPSSPAVTPSFFGRDTADETKYPDVQKRLQAVLNRHQLPITIPLTRQKLTTLTSDQLGGFHIGTQDYTVRVHTGDKSGAGTDANIFLSIKGSKGSIGEQRLNGLVSGNAFERNSTDTCVLKGLAQIGDIVSITVRSDDRWPGSAWYLSWIEISGKGLTTRRFTLNDWIEDGKLTRTLK